MNESGQKIKLKRRQRISGQGLAPQEGSHERGTVSTPSEIPSQVRSGWTFATSKGRATTGAQKAKWREITIEIVVNSTLSQKVTLVPLPPAEDGSGCQGSGVGVRPQGEDQSWLPGGYSEGTSATAEKVQGKDLETPEWQEVIVAVTL